MRARAPFASTRRGSRVNRFLATAAAAALALAAGSAGLLTPTAASAATGAIRNLPFCTTNALPASDDSSSPEVQLPFTMNF
ncbi:MAG: hypothetical protein J0H64_05875, partial [Actinobacteria bacterium]|nr:hypothetical protein [Actinomycetota bacterium]